MQPRQRSVTAESAPAPQAGTLRGNRGRPYPLHLNAAGPERGRLGGRTHSGPVERERG